MLGMIYNSVILHRRLTEAGKLADLFLVPVDRHLEPLSLEIELSARIPVLVRPRFVHESNFYGMGRHADGILMP
ncbi:hypothetical protein ACFX1Z_023284 [Malus domestica]